MADGSEQRHYLGQLLETMRENERLRQMLVDKSGITFKTVPAKDGDPIYWLNPNTGEWFTHNPSKT